MLSVFTMALLAAAPDAALLDALADQALAMEAFWKKASCELDVVGEEKDSDGKVTKSTKTSMRVARDGTTVTRTLLHHEENGKDLTEAKRKELEGNEGTKTSRSPFHPLDRSKYRFTSLTDDSSRIAFEPLGAKTEENLVGEAKVDPASRRVLSLDMRPAKFPMFVTELAIYVGFDADTPQGKGMSVLTVKGVAGPFFFRRGFNVVTTFRDYAALL